MAPADHLGTPDTHRLHPTEIVSMAWQTAVAEPARVIVPALVIFGLDALQSTLYTEIAVDRLGWESLAGVFVFGASTLGLTFYAGMLERLVGSVERGEAPEPTRQVLRTLPWLRLLEADAVLVVIGAAASLFIVVPGLFVDTLFALVGPLINLLGVSVPEALRKSVRVVWPHFALVFCLISLPLAIEHEVVVLIAELVPHEEIWLVFLTNFILGDLFGMALGLIEVTLAERLVRGAHGPGHAAVPSDVELLDPQVRPVRAPVRPVRRVEPDRSAGSLLGSDRSGAPAGQDGSTRAGRGGGHDGRDDPRHDHAGARAVAPGR